MVTTGERDNKLFHCPALTTIKLVFGKWKTRIRWRLRDRPYAFIELRRTLPGVSAKVLAEQIAQLENAQLIEKRQIEKVGQTHSCFWFASYGLMLIPVLDAFREWGLKHRQDTRRR